MLSRKSDAEDGVPADQIDILLRLRDEPGGLPSANLSGPAVVWLMGSGYVHCVAATVVISQVGLAFLRRRSGLAFTDSECA